MALYLESSSKAAPPPGKTEFEILKASHKFLREDDDRATSWDEQLAAKYYDSLFREYAVCDLKHYKSGNFALRWRTEAEVLAGAGETSCGNTRCAHHDPAARPTRPLSTLELPFTYAEHGVAKSALVKAVLCERCLGKLMWTRRKEKEWLGAGAGVKTEETEPVLDAGDARGAKRAEEPVIDGGHERGGSRRTHEKGDSAGERRHRRRDSRSRSPRPAGHRRDDARARRRSPPR
ncbi:folate-sensitive fragile site protein Fra10Ac1-domain-containing protein [Mycena rosella]|uniref:Folate-sensitive fragile site protein Fra10Ac1-domain-containing protein n=1 Tax=Mycena rosella TaxID=1033263 RepID=A0AAD7GXK2_MYCRO|nr:folate-sensitive fragile site protein Fra10Ac1-domain-containing protein [Mycena rosella]